MINYKKKSIHFTVSLLHQRAEHRSKIAYHLKEIPIQLSKTFILRVYVLEQKAYSYKKHWYKNWFTLASTNHKLPTFKLFTSTCAVKKMLWGKLPTHFSDKYYDKFPFTFRLRDWFSLGKLSKPIQAHKYAFSCIWGDFPHWQCHLHLNSLYVSCRFSPFSPVHFPHFFSFFR